MDYFSDIPMNEEAKKLLFDTYEEAGFRIIGYEKEKTGEKKEEREAEEQKESEVLAFYKKEVEGLDLPDEDSQKQLLKSGWKDRAARNRSSNVCFRLLWRSPGDIREKAFCTPI